MHCNSEKQSSIESKCRDMQNVTTASHYQYQNKCKGQSRIILKYREKERKKRTKIEREHSPYDHNKNNKGIHNNAVPNRFSMTIGLPSAMYSCSVL